MSALHEGTAAAFHNRRRFTVALAGMVNGIRTMFFTGIAAHFTAVSKLLANADLPAVAALARAVYETQKTGRTIFTFGNGGSAATALHLANNLSAVKGGPRVRVNCLTSNVCTISALANDISYDHIFDEQLKLLASPGDLAIAISASGNSPNCVNGLERAREIGLATACLVGFDGGKLLGLCDYAVHVPCYSYGIVEDIHLVITHSIVDALSPDFT